MPEISNENKKTFKCRRFAFWILLISIILLVFFVYRMYVRQEGEIIHIDIPSVPVSETHLSELFK